MEDKDNARTIPRTLNYQSDKGTSSGIYLRPKEHTSVTPIPTGTISPDGPLAPIPEVQTIPGSFIPNPAGAANPAMTIRAALGMTIPSVLVYPAGTILPRYSEHPT